MLGKGIKPIIAIAILTAFCRCSSKYKNEKYVSENFGIYASEYKTLNDSIKIYSDSLLHDFISVYYKKWQVDSLICINSDHTKLIATINESNGAGKEAQMDQIEKILGKRINNKWFFFLGGGVLAVPRDLYGKNEMNPLSFHELSQIARKEFLSGAIIKKDGKLVVSDEWVDAHFYCNGFYSFGKHKTPGMIMKGEEYQMPRDKARFDSVHWVHILAKWQKRFDTTGLRPLKQLP